MNKLEWLGLVKCGDCYALVDKDDIAEHMEWHSDIRARIESRDDFS